jgi:hypothetical protein
MYAAPRSPVIGHLVQSSPACLESRHAPGSPGDLAARLQDVAQRLPGVVPGDCLSRVLLTRPTRGRVGYA